MRLKSKIWLGIDPGIARTGYAILKESNKQSLEPIDYGCLTTPKAHSIHKRLFDLYSGLKKIIQNFKPTHLAIEKLFFSKNVKTALTVGQARGVILLAAEEAGLKISEFTPYEIKQAICGYGHADKKQIQHMVTKLLNLKSVPRPDDTADALAIAMCGSQTKIYS